MGADVSARLALLTVMLVLVAWSVMARAATGGGAEWRGPIGWGSFARLDLLPYVRHGVETFQASSADPTGHNDDGYTGRYSCLRRVRQGCLMAAHNGPGELESVWTAGNQVGNTAASGHLMIELDGRIVVDASWPVLTGGDFGNPFVFPVALGSTSRLGAESIIAPMPFRHSMRVISQLNPHYFHVVYRTFSSVRGVVTWKPGRSVPATVLGSLRRAGMRDPTPALRAAAAAARQFKVAPHRQVLVASLTGSGMITQLRLRFSRYGGFSADQEQAAVNVFRGARLRLSFDGRRTVDAPVGEFFGSGLGPAQVRSLMFAMDPTPHTWATTWWPMPFSSSVRIYIDNASSVPIVAGQVQLRFTRSPRWRAQLGVDGDAGYFHAQGHRGATRPGVYWTFLRTRGTGTFVGVTMTMMGGYPPYYLEGNERAYVDGARKPQIQGTGTEDFFYSGWYFGFDQLFTLPLSGYTAKLTNAEGCPRPTCKTAYRVMLADSVPFQRSILYEIQHGPINNIRAIYSSTAYWYQRRER
jgi:hypothetical protein